MWCYIGYENNEQKETVETDEAIDAVLACDDTAKEAVPLLGLGTDLQKCWCIPLASIQSGS